MPGETFHVDVNVGDPIWPGPMDVSLPRLLKAEPIRLRGYPMEIPHLLVDTATAEEARQAADAHDA
jgi:hypothetical protein